MSDLEEIVERIEAEQQDRQRMVFAMGDFETATVDDVRGIDLVIRAPGDEVALVARVSWGDGDVATDMSVYVDGQLTEHDGVALAGTTSIWATRRA